MKNDDEINICFCSDENLIEYIPVVLNSILSRNLHHKINIHYIHCIKDDSKIDKLKKYTDKFFNVSLITYYKEWVYKYKGLIHVTPATMLRIYIPEIIANIDIKKVLYLDIDVIVNLDLSEIFEIDCGMKGIAVKNSISRYWRLSKIGTPAGNCGVMLMDLSVLREEQFTQKCIDIFFKNEEKYHDQDIINIYLEGKQAQLKENHNIFLNQDDDKLLKTYKNNYILHFVGKSKPYFGNYSGKYQHIWDKYK